MSVAVRVALKVLATFAVVLGVAIAVIWPWPTPIVDWRTPLETALAKNDCARGGDTECGHASRISRSLRHAVGPTIPIIVTSRKVISTLWQYYATIIHVDRLRMVFDFLRDFPLKDVRFIDFDYENVFSVTVLIGEPSNDLPGSVPLRFLLFVLSR